MKRSTKTSEVSVDKFRSLTKSLNIFRLDGWGSVDAPHVNFESIFNFRKIYFFKRSNDHWCLWTTYNSFIKTRLVRSKLERCCVKNESHYKIKKKYFPYNIIHPLFICKTCIQNMDFHFSSSNPINIEIYTLRYLYQFIIPLWFWEKNIALE